MCWSLPVSITAGIFAYATAAGIAIRRKTRRDIWNSIFLFVFGTMQWIESVIWFLEGKEDLTLCSTPNRVFTEIGFAVIMLEPIANLIGRCYYNWKLPNVAEWIIYPIVFIAMPVYFARIQNRDAAKHICTEACSLLTDDRHIIFSIVWDSFGTNKCWKSNCFFGEFTYEIPVILRLAFLAGMVYPYWDMRPRLLGVLNSAVLTITWLVGYFSTSHASVWCLANVVQGIVMILDPYIEKYVVPKLDAFVRRRRVAS